MQPWAGMKIDKVAGIEARGFILGGAVARQGIGRLHPHRRGKLPHKRLALATASRSNTASMRWKFIEDAVGKGRASDPCRRSHRHRRYCGRRRSSFCGNSAPTCWPHVFVIDLPDLGGAEKLRKLNVPVRTLLIAFEGHLYSWCLLRAVTSFVRMMSTALPKCDEIKCVAAH